MIKMFFYSPLNIFKMTSVQYFAQEEYLKHILKVQGRITYEFYMKTDTQ